MSRRSQRLAGLGVVALCVLAAVLMVLRMARTSPDASSGRSAEVADGGPTPPPSPSPATGTELGLAGAPQAEPTRAPVIPEMADERPGGAAGVPPERAGEIASERSTTHTAEIEVLVRVLDDLTRQPVRGVWVVLHAGGHGLWFSASTNDAGEGRLAGVFPGRYRLSVFRTDRSGPGFNEPVVVSGAPSSGEARGLTLDLEAVRDRVELELRILPGGTSIRARVQDYEGHPVEGVRVICFRERNPGAHDQHTDSRGECLFDRLMPGAYKLVARGPGTAPALGTAHLETEGASIDIVLSLPRSGSIEGKVSAADGHPVPSTRVEASLSAGKEVHHLRRQQGAGDEAEEAEFDLRDGRSIAACQSDGSFSLMGLAPGLYDLVAVAPGHMAAVAREVPVTVDGMTPCDLVIQEGLAISGHLLDLRGRPYAAEGKLYYRPSGPSHFWRWIELKTGAFALQGLEAGPWDLWIQAKGAAEITIEAVAAGTSGLEVRVVALARLEATLVLPPGGARVESLMCGNWNDGEFERSTQVQVSPQGRFVWEGLEPTAAGIIVHAGGYVPWRLRPGPVEPGATLRMEVALQLGGAIRGRVVNPEGQPVPHASVAVQEVNGDEGGPTLSFSNYTDSEGRFQLDGVPPGWVRVLAQKMGYFRGRSDPMAVVEGKPIEGCTVVLPRE